MITTATPAVPMSIRDRVRAAITLAGTLGGSPLPGQPPAFDGPAFVSWAQPLVHAVVRTMRPLPSHDREDLAQEAFVGILRAARTFDPARGRSFAEWAARHAIQQLLDCVRWSRRHEPELLAGSLDDGEDEDDRPLADRAEGLADPRQDPEAAAEGAPRRRLAWAIAALAERAGDAYKAALDLLTSEAAEGEQSRRPGAHPLAADRRHCAIGCRAWAGEFSPRDRCAANPCHGRRAGCCRPALSARNAVRGVDR